MQILEYKLDRDYDGNLRTPPWVECGGFFHDHQTKTLIGFCADVVEFKIPDSVLRLTTAELVARVVSLLDCSQEEAEAQVSATVASAKN